MQSIPWYRQFWPWFLIAIPASAVIFSITIMIIFSLNKVDLVAEDHFKYAKATTQDVSRLNFAYQLDITAQLSVQDNVLTLALDKGITEFWPDLLILLTHRTLAENDLSLVMPYTGTQNYQHTIPFTLNGSWFIEVQPMEGEWKLQQQVTFPLTTSPIVLSGTEPYE